MSANTLINNTAAGPKIREVLLPTVQASTTFVPRSGGGDAKVGVDVPGYTGGGLRVDANTGLIGLRVSTGATGATKDILRGQPSGQVVLGDATNTGSSKLVTAGASGNSKVFNQIYDPVIENFSNPWIAALSSVGSPINFSQGFPVTGMYALSVKIIIPIGQPIPSKAITYYVENFYTKTIIPTITNTIAPGSLITVADSGAVGPLEFNYLHFGYLQRYNPHNFVASIVDPSWTGYVDFEVRWSQMC